MRAYRSIVTILLLTLSTFASGQSVTSSEAMAAESIRTGNEHYQNGSFSEALEAYMSVYSADLHSASLCYNIGNCYFKQNEIARAILFYERALRLDPSDEDILFNLELARSRIADRIESVPELFFVRWWNELRDTYGEDGWAVVAIISLVSFLVLLLLFLFVRSSILKKLIFWPSIIVLVVFVHALAFAWQKHRIAVTQPDAIIFSPAVTVKSAPDAESIDLFVIHEGTKVQITDVLGEWLEVKIPSGEKGWLDAAVLERI